MENQIDVLFQKDNKDSRILVNNRLSLDKVNLDNVDMFRCLNSVIFPVIYEAPFYQNILKHTSHLGFIVMFCGKPAGSLAFILAPSSLYIMTLGIIPELRGKGLGSESLRFLESHLIETGSVRSIKLHVHINNLGAKTFYEKNGYVVERLVENYYRDLSPGTAILMAKYF